MWRLNVICCCYATNRYDNRLILENFFNALFDRTACSSTVPCLVHHCIASGLRSYLLCQCRNRGLDTTNDGACPHAVPNIDRSSIDHPARYIDMANVIGGSSRSGKPIQNAGVGFRAIVGTPLFGRQLVGLLHRTAPRAVRRRRCAEPAGVHYDRQTRGSNGSLLVSLRYGRSPQIIANPIHTRALDRSPASQV